MFYLLLLLGFIALAAGVFVVGFGVPIRETAFGSALLMSGSVAVTGGFILVGLAAAVRELQRVALGLKARQAGVRPARPTERREEERHIGERQNGERQNWEHLEGAHKESADQRPEPRFPIPEILDVEAPTVNPAKFNALDAQERVHGSEPEWLQRAMAEVEAATRLPEATLSPDTGGTEEFQRPLDHAGREVPQPIAAAPHHTFDAVWPLEHHDRDGEPEQSAEISPGTATRTEEAKSTPLRPVPSRPVRAEPRPLPILKSGVIDEMAYTLFMDGSIEAQMPDGTMRFASIEELRRHLEQNGG